MPDTTLRAEKGLGWPAPSTSERIDALGAPAELVGRNLTPDDIRRWLEGRIPQRRQRAGREP